MKRTSIMAAGKRIVFVSNMTGSAWGGSEELWARTASHLVSDGLPVSASVNGWSPPHPRTIQLGADGVDVQPRRTDYQLWWRAWTKLAAPGRTPAEIEFLSFLADKNPALVVISDPVAWPPVGILRVCVEKGFPFVTISQANGEQFWPDENVAARYRNYMLQARCCYFVSKANRRLFENQIGCELPNSEIVQNPFNVTGGASLPPWPVLDESDELRIACVGRLHPPSKGQDILLEALAAPIWHDRNWRLTLYGEGPMRDSIEWMVRRFGLENRVGFAGFVTPVEKIWAENHVLAMPSRYEGMPLAIVEAMLCGRPVLATDVAGHSEIVEDGVSGFLADSPTASSLNRALEEIWAKRTELEAIGKVAAKNIRERFSADPARAFAEKIKSIANVE
jgi:glycosyltransferase involved in cell wall biosynthesis